jgi:hypothetical protein
MRPRHSVGHSHPDAPFPQFAPVSHVKFSVRPSSLSQRHPACCNSCSRTPEWSDCQCAGAFPNFTVPKPQKKRPKSKRTVLPSVSVKDFLRMYATRSFFFSSFFCSPFYTTWRSPLSAGGWKHAFTHPLHDTAGRWMRGGPGGCAPDMSSRVQVTKWNQSKRQKVGET